MIQIICGKSASGKDTLLKKMVEKYDLIPLITMTTRPMRDGEHDGVDYDFVSRDMFQYLIDHNQMLEYRSYNTKLNGVDDVWYYGNAKKELNLCNDYVIVLDLVGAKAFVDYYGRDNCMVTYLDVPNEIRERRARQRGSFDITEWNRRLEADEEDFSMNKVLEIADYVVKNYERDEIDWN